MPNVGNAFQARSKLIEQNRTAYFTGNCVTRLVLSGNNDTKIRQIRWGVKDLLSKQLHHRNRVVGWIKS